MKLERRSIPLELRAKGEGQTISGYSLRFNSLSQDLGGFKEQISPDCEITYDDPVALFNHDDDYVLGRLSAETLTLTRDDSGLLMEVTPPPTTWANDLMISMKRGDIKHQSFAFRVMPGGQQWSDAPDGSMLRTLTSIALYDVSVVTNPAYIETNAQVRSLSEVLEDRPATGQAAPPAQADGGVENLRLRLALAERQ